MISELRRAIRSLLRTPVFALTTVVSLALGIGACTAAFTVVRSVYFEPLPYADAEHLVEIWSTPAPTSRQRIDAVPSPRLRRWLGLEFRTLRGLAARGPTTLVLEGTVPRRVDAEVVSGRLFETLGTPALLGRTLTPEDDEPGAGLAAVVSEPFWEDHLAHDRRALGSTLRLSGDSYVVVGVMPRRFEALPRVWIAAEPQLARGFGTVWFPVARLREGATLEDVALELQQVTTAEVASDSALYAGFGAVPIPLGQVDRSMSAASLRVLGAGVVVVFLLALTNLTTLFLARAEERGRTAAVRAALGAGPWQLGRRLLLECALVAGAGTLAGLAVSVWGGGVIRAGIADQGAFAAGHGVDPLSFAFAAGLSLFAVALVGLEPMRHLRRLDLFGLLGRGASVTTLGPAQRRARIAILTAQVGLTVALASAGGALYVAHERLTRLELGYDADRLVVARPDYALADVADLDQWALASAVAERLARTPGVEGAAVWRMAQQSYPPRPEHTAIFEGGTSELPARFGLYAYYDVSAGFFETTGISIVAGRGFGPDDDAGSPNVGIISSSGARRWWPGQDPIGRRLRLGNRGEWITVVGVAEDAADLHQHGRTFSTGIVTRGHVPLPRLYRPMAQRDAVPPGWVTTRRSNLAGLDDVVVAARASGDTAPVTTALLREMSALAPRLPMLWVGPLLEHQMDALPATRLRGYRALAAVTAAIGMIMAFTGLVGLVADAVARRKREVGIRRALGARSIDVIAMLSRESILTVMLGLVLGAAAVLAMDAGLDRIGFNSFRELLLAVPLADFRVFAVVAGGMALFAALATLVGARKATEIDPATALRGD